MYKVILDKGAIKQLKKIPYKWQRRISAAIENLASDPFIGKKLHAELSENHAFAYGLTAFYTKSLNSK